MKIRVTLLTENNEPTNTVGETKQEVEAEAKRAWEVLAYLLEGLSEDKSEKCTVESVELVE